MTFSIVARCADTGQIGVAVCSSSIAVGARCAFVRAGAGAVATQNVTLPSLGLDALALLADGESAGKVLAAVLSTDAHYEYRQLLAVDDQGRPATFTGSQALGIHHARTGEQCAAAGNLLSSTSVIDAMVECFQASGGQALAVRLLDALQAAVERGGEAGPVHAAALLVADRVAWPVVNLRVDWADADPVGVLAKLWLDYAPQQQVYLQRALDPSEAPSYGVAGDE